MHIFKQAAGVISKEDVYICIHEGWMYIGNTMDELILILNTEWEFDKHLSM